jgi:ubiquinone/menaquinone biosynthesis C-methylase UbiE
MPKNLAKSLAGILRPALVLLLAFLIFGSVVLAYQAIRTIQQLNVVEAERDRWQRADDIIQQLGLKPGNTVVDFGSGAGYFTLKLSNTVGSNGEVLAVDLRRLSLSFLRARAILRWQRNIYTIVGEPADPHLSGRTVDAVLIANTYHELSEPREILRLLSQSMRPGGRLVVADRGDADHPAFPDSEESDLQAAGFQVVSREDRFIAQPANDVWWLITAVKPK